VATTEESDGYELMANPDRYETAWAFRIRLAEGEKKRLDFACMRIFNLTVSVHDSDGASAPLRGAHVVLDRMRGIVTTDLGEADSLGKIGFVGMRLGPVGLTVALEGYRTRYLKVALDGSKWQESLSVSLERAPGWEGRRVRGTLKNQYGDPWIDREIWFSCVTPDARPVLFAMTGEGGEYTISGIPEECFSGALHPFSGRDSLMISHLNRETEAYYIQKGTSILEDARQRKPGIKEAGVRVWYLDYTASGRKKRAR
jgi:hypothetical protein